MTKEPIMIDDVDVAECIHRIRKNEHSTYCNAFSSKVFDFDCSDFPTCYYKQLKIKEQKCEFLNDIILLKSKENDYKKQQLDQLKVENDALKKSILQECPNCGEEYLNYKGVELYDENEKYKQALQEIKEIANSDNHYFSDGTILRYEVVNKILQKISEVVDEKI